MTIPVAMTIAGSDSSGGAGIQTDLRTFYEFGVYGCSAITAITSQNPSEVTSIFPIPTQEVVAQIKTVLKTVDVKAFKTGMLFSAEIIKAVAAVLTDTKIPLVVDPVMISTSGVALINTEAVEVLKSVLLPLATVITPNIPEAEALSGLEITNIEEMHTAAKKLATEFGCAVLIKGGHGQGEHAVDLLFSYDLVKEFSTPRLMDVKSSHGSGCTLASAIAAHLAMGHDLESSVQLSKDFVTKAITGAVQIGEACYGMWGK
ncbi:MAG: bifunctional hydroxymethylpyrimidine kinase/phosphomethylpyrimidine kinase [Lentisphaeria bacterium]|nr:bifunctional hydroxymethylpyrimidine kinase/phosphomethylpyrimidine kinase [Lentisphaeria bacterium]